jgi:hypothetical protein
MGFDPNIDLSFSPLPQICLTPMRECLLLANDCKNRPVRYRPKLVVGMPYRPCIRPALEFVSLEHVENTNFPPEFAVPSSAKVVTRRGRRYREDALPVHFG